MNIYLLDRNQETTNKNEKPELLHPSVPKKIYSNNMFHDI